MTPHPPRHAIRIDGTTFTYDATQARLALEQGAHSTQWRPAGHSLAAAVRVVESGMADDDRPSEQEIADQIRSVAALSFLVRKALSFGLRDIAIANAASMIAEIEKLAQVGSEDAAAAMQIAADRLRRDGIADEAFAAARDLLRREQD